MRRATPVIAVAALLAAGCGTTTPVASNFVEVPGFGVTRADVPRPSGRAGDDCTLALDPAATIEERAFGLRAAGLFADSSLDDAELGAEIEEELQDEWGGSLTPSDPLYELFVAELDRSRVWWRDLEADVFDGNDVYVAVLEELATISLGAFAPASVTESWASEVGPVTVSFELDGREHVLEPAYLEDWIDPTILDAINGLIGASGRRFEILQAFDQTAYVLALAAEERAALETRGWCFE